MTIIYSEQRKGIALRSINNAN